MFRQICHLCARLMLACVEPNELPAVGPPRGEDARAHVAPACALGRPIVRAHSCRTELPRVSWDPGGGRIDRGRRDVGFRVPPATGRTTPSATVPMPLATGRTTPSARTLSVARYSGRNHRGVAAAPPPPTCPRAP